MKRVTDKLGLVFVAMGEVGDIEWGEGLTKIP